MSLRRVSPAGRAWRPPCKSCTTVDMDPTVPWEYFLCPDFFLYLHQQRQRPVFLQLSLTIARYVLLHTLGPFPARSKRNRARPTRGPVERRFLIEFSSIFMKILACRLAGHPVTFLAMYALCWPRYNRQGIIRLSTQKDRHCRMRPNFDIISTAKTTHREAYLRLMTMMTNSGPWCWKPSQREGHLWCTLAT